MYCNNYNKYNIELYKFITIKDNITKVIVYYDQRKIQKNKNKK